MSGFYDASAPPPDDAAGGAASSGDSPLLGLEDEVVTNRLRAAMERASHRFGQVADRLAVEPLTPLEYETITSICEAEDARLDFRHLAERVARGETTYEQIWQRIELYGQVGVDLMAEVMREMAALAEQRRDEGPAADADAAPR